MKLIVGLGNPWKEYAQTRHNAGFLILDQWVQGEWLGNFRMDTKYNAEILETNYQWQKIVCMKPQTYMNRSGWSVAAYAHFYKIEASDILVIHDEIDFVTGRIQMKLWWSAAGHNGLRDIIAKLATDQYWRLRIWVDRPNDNKQVADYVLGIFTRDDIDKLDSKQLEIEAKIKEFLSM